MNPLDFAMELIRAPFIQKLKDRTFQTLIATAVAATTAAFAAWHTAGIDVNGKLNVTFTALGAWSVVAAAFTVGDKIKDGKIAAAAIAATPAAPPDAPDAPDLPDASPTPSTVTAFNVLDETPVESVPAESAQSAPLAVGDDLKAELAQLAAQKVIAHFTAQAKQAS